MTTHSYSPNDDTSDRKILVPSPYSGLWLLLAGFVWWLSWRRSKLLVSSKPDEHSLPSASVQPQPTASGPKSKHVWVRINGIPTGWNRKDIRDALNIIDADFDVETQLHNDDISIFPACVGDSQVALCQLDSSAGFVPDLTDNYHRIPLKGRTVSLAIDRHFYDLTPLNAPEGPIVADVVAVTSPVGHAFGSWWNRKTSQIWLKDFLPKDVKRIRVMTYGYNSNVVGDTVDDGFLVYRQSFIQSILNVRQGSENRPIIFIGHSMGGILLLQVLLQCKHGGQYRQLFDATQSVFFFGTPHQGMEVRQIVAMIKDQDGFMDPDVPESRWAGFVKQLKTGSYFLDTQREDTLSLWDRTSGIEVFSFYETRKTPTVAKSDSGDRERTDDEIEVVSKSSAQLFWQFEHRIPVDANHTDIVKFPYPEYATYRTLVRCMNACIERIGSNPIGVNGPLVSALVPPSRSAASAERQFVVPFPHNPSYVERKEIHDRLDELLAPRNDHIQPRAALWGLGGMGKTTIAVEYCYRCWRDRPATSIFWVHANSDETFQASYQDIAKRIGIKAQDQDETTLQDAVRLWLESPDSGEWILVIDNLDDPNIDPQYIPARQGTILFTTRDSSIPGDPRFAVPKNARVEVQKMSLGEASSMCVAHRMVRSDDLDLSQSSAQIELLELLENLPLAIAQAAAYIRNTGMRIQQYIELYKESVDNQKYLLDKPLYDSEVSKEDLTGNSSRTVMRTWAITIEKIKAKNPLALEVLQFMSVINPEEVSLKIIRAVPRFREAGSLILLEALGLLLNFALLTSLESASHYRLHRLVSFWSRATMEIEKKNGVLHIAAESLQRSFPDDMIAHLPTCSELLPHAVVLLQHIHESSIGIEFDGIFMLQHSAAGVFKTMGEYNKALEWFQRALDGCEKTLGKDHPDTLTTVNNIAGIYGKRGEHKMALEWFQRALGGREKVLGEDHPDTLTTVNNMIEIYSNQGEHEKALEWCQRALDGREKALGKGHPDTLATVNNMGIMFRRQGECKTALEWFQRALDGREKTLGKDHPDTLATVNNMAGIYSKWREHEKALEWFQRALDGFEKTLGENHPNTLAAVNGMAMMFKRQGEYEKALEWYQRALDGREKALGKDHPTTLATVKDMAMMFKKKGEYEKALEWYQRILDGREKTLGKDHPNTLTTVNSIAGVYGKRGRHKMALEWYQRALDGREKALGKNHLDTLTTVNSMAIMFYNQGEYEKALEWYQRALDGREKILGKDHPNILTTVNNMAILFNKQGEYEKALGWYQRALGGREKILGKDHPNTLTTVNNMAIMFNELAEYEKALEWYQRALDGREKTLGKDHPDTLATVKNMAIMFKKQREYEKALE